MKAADARQLKIGDFVRAVNGAAASDRRLKLDVDRRSRSTDCYAACFFGGRTRWT